MDNEGRLRPGMTENHEYCAISASAWSRLIGRGMIHSNYSQLLALYGGGPAVERTAEQISKYVAAGNNDAAAQ